MRKILFVLVLSVGVACCGARAKAVEHAELQCLDADLQSLKQKISDATAAPEATALDLSIEELRCAANALSVQPAATGSGSAAALPDAALPDAQ